MFDRFVGYCAILTLVLIVLNLLNGVYGGLSGLYVDEGDQTVMHHALTSDDTEEVEREILELLGLPDRPRKRNIHPSLRYENNHFCVKIRCALLRTISTCKI